MTAALLASAALVAGCGGGGGSTDHDVGQITQTVQTALADLARADGTAFCALATPAGQAKLAGALPGVSCARLVALAGSRLSSATRAGLLHAHVTHVTVRGAAATVAASDIRATTGSLAAFLSGNGPTTLRRERDGTWKISG
jgi:hypothetical protein